MKVILLVSPGSLQNLTTKDLATEEIKKLKEIQNSLLGAKELREEANKLVPKQRDKPDSKTMRSYIRVMPNHVHLCMKGSETLKTRKRELS